MRTIKRHRPSTSPAGDCQRVCGYCGVVWLRSQLRRDAAGILACPDDQRGLDSLTLSEGNAEAASHRQLGQRMERAEGAIEAPNTVPYPGFIDPNGPPDDPINTGPTGPLSVVVEAWLRGDSAETNGVGQVTRWRDLSNRSNHFLPPVLNNSPFKQTDSDGLPMVSFNGVTQWLVGTKQSPSRPQWGWIICQYTGVTGICSILRANPGIAAFNSGGMKFFQTGGVANGLTFISFTVGDWFRLLMQSDAADVNNTLSLRSATVTNPTLGPISSVPILGAGNINGASAAPVRFKEVLLTNGIPNAGEIAAIEAYGVARYGGGYFA